MNTSESKSTRQWFIFLFSTDASSLISEINLIQIVDPSNTILPTVIKIFCAIKRTLSVTCREFGIYILFVSELRVGFLCLLAYEASLFIFVLVVYLGIRLLRP